MGFGPFLAHRPIALILPGPATYSLRHAPAVERQLVLKLYN
jgi:hypothetical protein